MFQLIMLAHFRGQFMLLRKHGEACKRCGRGTQGGDRLPQVGRIVSPRSGPLPGWVLSESLELAVAHYPALADFADTLPEYTEFAVRLRYDDVSWVTREETEVALKEVERLRGVLIPLLG